MNSSASLSSVSTHSITGTSISADVSVFTKLVTKTSSGILTHACVIATSTKHTVKMVIHLISNAACAFLAPLIPLLNFAQSVSSITLIAANVSVYHKFAQILREYGTLTTVNVSAHLINNLSALSATWVFLKIAPSAIIANR